MGLFPPFCILFHFVPHPLDQRLDRRLIPLQFVRDLRDGFSLPELGSDEAFYLLELFMNLISEDILLSLPEFILPYEADLPFFIIFKDTHCDHLRSVLGEEVRKDPLLDVFCDSPVYCRPDRHSLCMEPHPLHKEHMLF